MNTVTHTAIASVLTALTFAAFSASTARAESSSLKNLKVRTTAYTHTEASHAKYGKSTAAGTQLRFGQSYTSAASDWSVFPLGTVFRIKGVNRTFVIDDYGSALVGSETIDLYKPSRQMMNTWGVKHVEIEIIKFGCYQKSLRLLEGRTRYAHCKQMHNAIKKQIQS